MFNRFSGHHPDVKWDEKALAYSNEEETGYSAFLWDLESKKMKGAAK